MRLGVRLDELERKSKYYDDAIVAILYAIPELRNLPATMRRGVDFTADISDPN